MMRDTINFEWKGRLFTRADFDDCWDIEIHPGEAAECKHLLGINDRLCEVVTIAKTRGGHYFLLWEEYHPEVGSWMDFEAVLPDGVDVPTREAARDEWYRLSQEIPSASYFRELTLKAAAEITAFFWLPHAIKNLIEIKVKKTD